MGQELRNAHNSGSERPETRPIDISMGRKRQNRMTFLALATVAIVQKLYPFHFRQTFRIAF